MCCLCFIVYVSYMFTVFIALHFFFFKQKLAYVMRISDWSSDVFSSDLLGRGVRRRVGVVHRPRVVERAPREQLDPHRVEKSLIGAVNAERDMADRKSIV